MNKPYAARASQQGAILIITLVIMAAMTLASVGLLRSVDTTMLLSSNLGFKRDVAMRASVANQQVLSKLRSAGFLSMADNYCYPGGPCPGGNTENYSPIMLQADAEGVPVIMLPANTTLFNSVFKGTLAQSANMTNARVTIYYLLERMCDAAGSPSLQNCTYYDSTGTFVAGAGDYRGEAQSDKGVGDAVGIPGQPLFRLTVRAEGPRNSSAYVQTIVAIL